MFDGGVNVDGGAGGGAGESEGRRRLQRDEEAADSMGIGSGGVLSRRRGGMAIAGVYDAQRGERSCVCSQLGLNILSWSLVWVQEGPQKCRKTQRGRPAEQTLQRGLNK